MLRNTAWLVTAACACGVLALAERPSAEPERLPGLLTAYAAGRFDEAIRTVERGGDAGAEALGLEWGAARPWIAAAPDDRRRRYLVVAAFALETERLRAERNDWSAHRDDDCKGRCVLDWAAHLMLERGEPDDAERLWWQAAVALVGGVRDWGFLVSPLDPRQPFGLGSGILSIALKRFPDDPRFRLDRAIAVASRFSVTTDGERRSAASPLTAALANFPTALGTLESQTRPQRQVVLAATVGELSQLSADPVVGVEARVRLGYLRWATGHDEEARGELAAAAAAATEADLRYLAYFLVGMEALGRKDVAAAASAFGTALDARPHSESASLALAALALQRGEAERAYALAREPFADRPGDVDPWRQFLYGRFPQLPALIGQLRAGIVR
jgi:hypothetical protein